MTLELSLALKEINRLYSQGFNGYALLTTAGMNHLISQGFSRDYSQKIAQEAFNLVVGE